jgi:hypothetical protein
MVRLLDNSVPAAPASAGVRDRIAAARLNLLLLLTGLWAA